MAEGLMLVALGALTTGATVALVRLQRRVALAGQAIERSDVQLAELKCVLDNAQRLLAASAVAEVTVEGGTRLVQGVHQGIAAIPFTVFEAIPVTRDTAKVVRKTHDTVAGGVYGGISAVNKFIGRVLRGTGKPPDK